MWHIGDPVMCFASRRILTCTRTVAAVAGDCAYVSTLRVKTVLETGCEAVRPGFQYSEMNVTSVTSLVSIVTS